MSFVRQEPAALARLVVYRFGWAVTQRRELHFTEQRHTAAGVSPGTVPTVRIPTGPPLHRSRTGSAAIEAARKPLETQCFVIGLWTAVLPKTPENLSQSRFVSQPLDFVWVRFRGLLVICSPWFESKRAQSYKSMSCDLATLICRNML